MRRINPVPVTITGGDPSYLKGLSVNHIIDQENITYHALTSEYATARRLYASAKINLNITFKYYCVESPADLELCQSYGFQVHSVLSN